ncbi:MAG TPA: phosphoribosyltransferase family protein [Duganella sp.]|nr:phosphoribosyltransferase family protein [Duganella sp.]
MKRLTRLKNRSQAGELLAQRLGAYAGRHDVIVLALPRGGVPVGFSVAQALSAPLDILLVRKLGVPGQKELAMGAIASGGVCVLQQEVLRVLDIPKQVVEAAVQREMREIERREKLYRANRPMLDVRDHVVILVDDGMATGTTMLAAVHVLREKSPSRVVVAVPVAALDTSAALRSEVDELICPLTPASFRSVGEWYDDFDQTSDDEVRLLLAKARKAMGSTRKTPPTGQASRLFGAKGTTDEAD